MKEPTYRKDKSLEHLRRISKRLPDFITQARSHVDYEVDGGRCFGLRLKNSDRLAVQCVYISKGATFPLHDHIAVRSGGSVEYMICYEGKVRFFPHEQLEFIGGEKGVVSAGEAVFVPKWVPHGAEALEDSWLLCVTIPSAEGYPS